MNTALPTAPPQPWYRNRRLWWSAIIWAVALPFLMSFNLSAVIMSDAQELNPYRNFYPLMGFTLITGTVITYVGLLLQRVRLLPGIRVVAAGLFIISLSLTFPVFLGIVVVCYETRFIAAEVPRKRLRWLFLIYAGTLFTIAYHIAGDLYLRHLTGMQLPPLSEREMLVGVAAIAVMLLFIAALIQLFWQFGRTIFQRNQEVSDLKAKAELAAVTERNRIAREMHDIIAHSLTVVIAQADGGRFAAKKSPEQAVQALTTISKISRESLSQMRQLLSVLRSPQEERETATNPGVHNLQQLFKEAGSLELKLETQILGEVPELNEALDLTIYRIVQELITNALKHSSPGIARLVIDYGTAKDRARQIHITADSRGNSHERPKIPGAGRGLTGIKERVLLYGGECYWGESLTFPGGFHVDLRIPLPK